jgi:methionine synthase I (cobalamin-dependent)
MNHAVRNVVVALILSSACGSVLATEATAKAAAEAAQRENEKAQANYQIVSTTTVVASGTMQKGTSAKSSTMMASIRCFFLGCAAQGSGR